MQADLFNRAKKFRDANLHEVDSYDDFKKRIEEPGGFYLAHWDGTRETEDRIADETKATIRCIPFDRKQGAGQVHGHGAAVGGARGVGQGVLGG